MSGYATVSSHYGTISLYSPRMLDSFEREYACASMSVEDALDLSYQLWTHADGIRRKRELAVERRAAREVNYYGSTTKRG